MGQFEFPSTDQDSESQVAIATAALANCVLEFRRERSRLMGADLFSDPAWEILLVIQALDPDDKGMSAADLLAEISPGPGTMNRWLCILIERKLIERREADDGETYHLSEMAKQTLISLFGLIRSIL